VDVRLTQAEVHGVQFVADQLTQLERRWGKGVTVSDVYSLVGILRTLLPDQAFARAWGLVWPPENRTRATLVAPDLNALVTKGDWPRVVHAQTAGLARPSMHLWLPVAFAASPFDAGHPDPLAAALEREPPRSDGAAAADASLSGVTLRSRGAVMSGLIDQNAVPVEPPSPYRRYRLSAFVDAPCLIHRGQAYTRGRLVRLLANQLGPAHLTWDGSESGYEMLTGSAEWLRVTARNPVLYEVLSIGQILAHSSCALAFRRRVEELQLPPLH
jgi:hypothetical protein